MEPFCDFITKGAEVRHERIEHHCQRPDVGRIGLLHRIGTSALPDVRSTIVAGEGQDWEKKDKRKKQRAAK
jgi:hypothetical protein